VLLTIKNDIGVDLASQRSTLIGLGSRGAVMYRLADDNATNPIANRPFIDANTIVPSSILNTLVICGATLTWAAFFIGLTELTREPAYDGL